MWGHTVGRGAGKFPFELEMGRKEVWGGEKYLVSGGTGLVRREEREEQMKGDDLLLSLPLEDQRGRMC